MATAKKKVTKKVTKKKSVNNPLGVKFESGLSLPVTRNGFQAKVRQTLDMMSVGESFLYAYESTSEDKIFQSAISLVRKEEKKYEHSKDYCTRKVDGGRRVWRLS